MQIKLDDYEQDINDNFSKQENIYDIDSKMEEFKLFSKNHLKAKEYSEADQKKINEALFWAEENKPVDNFKEISARIENG